MSAELPPLPEKSYIGDDVSWGYDDDDMRDYALAALAARKPLEAAAPALLEALEAVWFQVPLRSDDLRNKVDAALAAAKGKP